MSAFLERLPRPEPRDRWIWVPYDQLTDAVGPLAEADPPETGVVFIETTWKPGRRPYHQQKLALVLANQRHFALELAEAGFAVDYRFDDRPYEAVLTEVLDERGGLVAMEPAERELRGAVADLDGLRLVEHAGWLSTEDDFASLGEPPWRMDTFYRRLRKRTGILMEGGKPVGGRYSFDGENRESWPGEPAPPEPPTFSPDDVTREVAELVAERFGDHPGQVDLATLPATKEDAETLWAWAKEKCLPTFGPFEDAMTTRSSGLWHTRISPLLNLHRLLPRRVVDEALELDLPHASVEGFVRQILGWREFVRHVHRRSPDMSEDVSHLGTDGALPAAYWPGSPSGLRCLDTVVDDVWREGWSHHITRLMVLSNVAQLLDVSPRELTDWFWVAYVDAYDWVVEPNVMGMGTFALGDRMTTKPYVSGSAYIDRMSDYCGDCAFDPKKTCPLTSLFWAYLGRHRERLGEVNRMRMMLASERKRSDEQKEHDAAVFEEVRDMLARGERLGPEQGELFG